jgi:oxygen-independent coproporphyrinogen-3 oxidase
VSLKRLGVYVHVPFCSRKCSYCSFISYERPAGVSEAGSYVSAAFAELKARAPEKNEDFEGWTLFIGGGTPTMLKDGQLERLVMGVIDQMRLRGWEAPLEASIEANPGTFSAKSAKRLVKAGVTRFSIGIQSLCDDELKAIGRIHSAEDAELAIVASRYSGTLSTSLDIMVGLPGQSTESLMMTLEGVLALKPDHVSVYGLTVEEGTPLHSAIGSGLISVPDDDAVADMLDMAAEWLNGMGLERYEISNYAKPGHECIHNMIYWSDMPYIGIGAAAHSYDPDMLVRSWNVKGVEEYISRCSKGLSPEEGREQISRLMAFSDALILALRTSAGASIEKLEARYKMGIPAAYMGAFVWSKSEGMLIVKDDGSIALTPKGMMLSNTLFTKLVE